jgi:hypothetical protein
MGHRTVKLADQDLVTSLSRHRRRLQPSTTNPLQDRPVLPAFFIAMPPLPAIMRCQVITNIARAVRGPGGLDEHQALGWVVDVDYVHGVPIVVFAVLVGEDALIVGWAQLEDDMAGMAEDASFAVRALSRQNGLDLGHKVIEVEHRAGLHVLQGFAELLALQDAGGDQLQSWIVVVLQLLHGGAKLRPLLYAFHLS